MSRREVSFGVRNPPCVPAHGFGGCFGVERVDVHIGLHDLAVVGNLTLGAAMTFRQRPRKAWRSLSESRKTTFAYPFGFGRLRLIEPCLPLMAFENSSTSKP